MSKFTKELVDNYAEKLLIGLTEEENEMVLKEFDMIEEAMEVIASIPNISEVTPMTHALDDFTFTLRSDSDTYVRTPKELLKNCDKQEDNLVSVPKVVG